MSSRNAGVDENVRFFLAECRDMLEDVEPRLIELEKYCTECGEVDEEIVNLIFRLFHSLKGSAGFFQFNTIVGVTHSAETLLDMFRSGQSQMGPQHTDILCRVCDAVHALLDQVENTGGDEGLEERANQIILELTDLISNEELSGASPIFSDKRAGEAPLNIALTDDEAGLFDVGFHFASNDQDESSVSGEPVGPEMLERFLLEGDEQLEKVEQALLNLEKTTDSEIDIEEAFRNLHSFKGNCGFIGQAELEGLSHLAENILGAIKDKMIIPGKQNIPTLLYVIDVMRNALADLSAGGRGEIENASLFSDMLDDLIPADVREKSLRPVITEKQALWLLRENTTSDPPPSEPIERQDDKPDAPAFKSRSVFRQDIRVDLGKLDLLINLVGEMVIAESMVTKNPDLKGHEFENFERAAAHLNKIVRDLQDVALSVRMIPIAGVFRKMIRLVHDLSIKADKKIDLELRGEDTEIDKTVAELIADPLVHLVRNSIDHGIELPGDRLAAGKSETGSILLEARHEGGEVWIIIRDDGRGLSRPRILNKGIENGLVQGDGSDLSDQDVYNLIFEPGFSTAEKITDISGRGVGMDVVKKNIERIKGRVDVYSQPGLGTTFVLRIPLTLAIMDGMLVRVGRNRYSIPLLSIRESIQVKADQITVTMDGQEVVRVREELLPVLRLHELHKIEPDQRDLTNGLLVLLEGHGEAFCLFVDEILGEHQTVIKGLSGYLGDVRGVSGCTILGDGEVSLILDVGGLVNLAMTENGASGKRLKSRRSLSAI
jgi:two-component system, chemotaxis family, sensor kinase CheA